jgi:redox-regulated HSP33 family molecular chaperone
MDTWHGGRPRTGRSTITQTVSTRRTIISSSPFSLKRRSSGGGPCGWAVCWTRYLGPHDYPLPVAHLVAETITLAALLSSMLKYEGIFTLQTKGDGPVGMLVADMTSKGEVRGCASFDKERVAKFGNDTDLLPLFLGKGYIAFTVDQMGKTDRYQGIVELKGKSLVECVQHYFTQSEQIRYRDQDCRRA